MARNNSIFSGSRFILKALVLTILFTVLWVLANLGSLREYLDTTKARRAEHDKIEVLRQRIENLRGQQRSLVSGGMETERQVRERFRMHKPGEQVIFLESDTEPTTPTLPPQPALAETPAPPPPAAATAAPETGPTPVPRSRTIRLNNSGARVD